MTTTSLSSSLDVLSLTSSTRWTSDSLSDEDEIVWSLSSSAHLSTSPPLQSPLSETADFVLVPRVTATPSASPTADTVADEMAALTLTPAVVPARGNAGQPASPSPNTPQRTSVQGPTATRRANRAAQQSRGPQAPTTAPPAVPRKKIKKATKRTARGSSSGSTSSASSTGGAAASSSSPRPSRIRTSGNSSARLPTRGATAAPSTTTGLGARAVVDDSLSETSETSTSTSPAPTTGFQEAHKYMTSYLAHPPAAGNNGSALLMLQALILELGCLGPSVAASKFAIPQLPATLRQAKLLLKSHAFINVRDYLAVREQGQDALQRAMHPNRKSLVKEVRKGKRMPVGEVKKAGLNVLLVNTRL